MTPDPEELLDLIEDLVAQGCAQDTYGTEYDDCAISTYEDAMDLLARCRPEKWQLTRRGMVRRTPI